MKRIGEISILLIEDDPQDAEIIEVFLRDAGIEGEIYRAFRLEEALILLDKTSVDLVLLDLGLPGTSGIDTFRSFIASAPDLPVVVLSGLRDEDVSVRAVHEGAQDYLVKGSIGVDLLRRSLSHALERHRMRLELTALSLTDELTGLSNRRGFLTLAEQLCKTARRLGENVFLAYADMDGMKRINDDMGHDAGDKALKDFAKALKSTFRDSDIVARLGGDEFAALGLMEKDVSMSTLQERLDANLNQATSDGGHAIPLAASLGLVTAAPAEVGLPELIAKADEMMYDIKRKKRAARL